MLGDGIGDANNRKGDPRRVKRGQDWGDVSLGRCG